MHSIMTPSKCLVFLDYIIYSSLWQAKIRSANELKTHSLFLLFRVDISNSDSDTYAMKT